MNLIAFDESPYHLHVRPLMKSNVESNITSQSQPRSSDAARIQSFAEYQEERHDGIYYLLSCNAKNGNGLSDLGCVD